MELRLAGTLMQTGRMRRRLHFDFKQLAETVSRSLSRPIAWFQASPTASAAVAGLVLVFFGYAAAFLATLDQPVGSSMFYAANNTLGIGLAGTGFYQLLARFVVDRRPAVAAALHVPLAVAFRTVSSTSCGKGLASFLSANRARY